MTYKEVQCFLGVKSYLIETQSLPDEILANDYNLFVIHLLLASSYLDTDTKFISRDNVFTDPWKNSCNITIPNAANTIDIINATNYTEYILIWSKGKNLKIEFSQGDDIPG